MPDEQNATIRVEYRAVLPSNPTCVGGAIGDPQDSTHTAHLALRAYVSPPARKLVYIERRTVTETPWERVQEGAPDA